MRRRVDTPDTMKKLLTIGCLLMLSIAQFSCSKQDVPRQEPKPTAIKLNRDSVKAALYRPLYVAEAYRFIGKDSADLFKVDTLYNLYRNAVFLQFYFDEGYLTFWSGKPFANTEIPGNALTFGVQVRVDYVTGLRVYWDEELGTARVESNKTSNYLPMVIPGKKAYLETSSFLYYLQKDQAQAAKSKPRLVFVYDDEDPKLGKVKYKITLKPMYEYYREPYQQTWANFAVY